MRFGVREICNVVFRAKATQYLGSRKFYKNEPVMYFDTLKTSSLEGAATTVYATGGRGNTQLVAWEGERTLTFTMEDALISPEGFAILSGAGLIDASKDEPIYVHQQYTYEVKEKNTIVLPEAPCWNRQYKPGSDLYHKNADIFVMTMTNGEIDSEPCIPVSIGEDGVSLTCYSHSGTIDIGDIVMVDYYVKRIGGAKLIEITPDQFGGYYYVEAATLFRDENTGIDMPAEFIIPKAKVQSNFTFSMASSGDPSTFTFTMDAFPDYVKFKETKKVLAALQVISEAVESTDERREPCREVQVEVWDEDNITVTYDNNGTEEMTKITVSGNDVNGDNFYDTALFGDLHTKGSVTELDLKALPVEDDKMYKITQQNPVLSAYYKEDPNVIGNVKTKVYAGSALSDGYGLLLSDIPGPIVVKVIEVEEDTDASGNTRKNVKNEVVYRDVEQVRAITIKNNVTFKKVDRTTVVTPPIADDDEP